MKRNKKNVQSIQTVIGNVKNRLF